MLLLLVPRLALSHVIVVHVHVHVGYETTYSVMAFGAPVSHLSNPLATPLQLSNSSSQADGIPVDLETSIRFAGARLTQAAGVLLRLPQDVVAQAIVLYSRFWVAEGGSLRVFGAKVCAT